MKRQRWFLLVALISVLGLVAAACGDDDEDTDTGDDAPTEEEGADEPAEDDEDTGSGDDAPAEDEEGAEGGDEMAGSLSDCPNPLVIQTDWFPESEHGGVYNLMGGDFTVDPDNGRSTGPLAADPSLTIEVRAGGPYLGDQDTISVMATDPDVFLGYTNTDEATANYDRFPTTAVAAPLDINPQMVMWDPETYPDVEEWADVGESGATILAFAGGYYPTWLIGSGLTEESQWDFSYDGSPARFISEGGAVMQQGFATQEPFNYENVFTEWGKPVETLLVHDSGYEIYQGALTILDENLDDAARSCLTAFVPIAQQSFVDFIADPGPTNEAILAAVEDLDSFWELSPEGVEWTTEQMVEGGFVGNGHNDTAGDFDLDRVQGVIDLIAENVPDIEVPEGLTAEDLVTNEFIDESISY